MEQKKTKCDSLTVARWLLASLTGIFLLCGCYDGAFFSALGFSMCFDGIVLFGK